MTDTTPARWPLFDVLSQWARACALPGDEFYLTGKDEEAQRIAAHLRGGPDDLRFLAGRDPGNSELLPHMLWAAGVDESRLPRDIQAELARVCGTCHCKPHCASELARNRAGDSYAGFCPNAAAIRVLRGD